MPRIDADLKLDFKDVLLRPKRSSLKSRSEVGRSQRRLGVGRLLGGAGQVVEGGAMWQYLACFSGSEDGWGATWARGKPAGSLPGPEVSSGGPAGA